MCWGRFDGAIWFACFICLLACFSLLHFLCSSFSLVCLPCNTSLCIEHTSTYLFFSHRNLILSTSPVFSISADTNTPPCSSLPPFLPLSLSFFVSFSLFLSPSFPLFSLHEPLALGLVWSSLVPCIYICIYIRILQFHSYVLTPLPSPSPSPFLPKRMCAYLTTWESHCVPVYCLSTYLFSYLSIYQPVCTGPLRILEITLGVSAWLWHGISVCTIHMYEEYYCVFLCKGKK